MADKLTIARPYAKAAFEEARQLQHLSSWSQSLRTAAIVVQDPQVQDLLGNPSVTPAQLAQFVIDLAGEKLDENGRNFVRTLAENHRLAYLPEISTLFEVMKDEAEGVIDVTVTSAAPLESAQQQTLVSALQRRLQRQVRLHCHTDAALIGGAVLRAGDLVIDGSLRARLDRIAYELTA
ncbi:MAG: F0F1 ATP synthase subunit delta [Sinobacteraceae bacterium]|nr:F0F1 ATP synthase subunit delta [Nevskiaceae bacterium]MBV9911691.1 F0F1 ATP synthase subunit delta [Nevskiaceae bacterium]